MGHRAKIDGSGQTHAQTQKPLAANNSHCANGGAIAKGHCWRRKRLSFRLAPPCDLAVDDLLSSCCATGRPSPNPLARASSRLKAKMPLSQTSKRFYSACQECGDGIASIPAAENPTRSIDFAKLAPQVWSITRAWQVRMLARQISARSVSEGAHRSGSPLAYASGQCESCQQRFDVEGNPRRTGRGKWIAAVNQDILRRKDASFMAQRHLRVYHGPQNETATLTQTSVNRETCHGALGRCLAPIGRRRSQRRTWLQDFKNDEITISSDLYEVILAYQHYRRPSA